jgi:hypothetical protein
VLLQCRRTRPVACNLDSWVQAAAQVVTVTVAVWVGMVGLEAVMAAVAD